MMNKLILVIGILLTSVQLQAACGCSKNKQKQEFRVGHYYKTRNPDICKVLILKNIKDDGKVTFPLVGEVFYINGNISIESYTLEGKLLMGMHAEEDLQEEISN